MRKNLQINKNIYVKRARARANTHNSENKIVKYMHHYYISFSFKQIIVEYCRLFNLPARGNKYM